jgi:glycosyltransferase involved in cell wall biosynthesis
MSVSTSDHAGSSGTTASQGASVSVVVPCFNRPEDLKQCLAALQEQEVPAVEILVADDASTDDTPEVARSLGAHVVALPGRSGAALARNAAAAHACGDILLFLDSDVVARPSTVASVVRVLTEDPGLAAVFGSYDAEPAAGGTVSHFRNLLHHYTHQMGEEEATTFWAGCGAIRRDVFSAIGGFDPTWEGIEDIELGYRLRAHGHRVRLERGLQVRHLKHWTLGSMVKTDFRMRGVPWSRLMSSYQYAPDHLNVRASQRASVALVGATLLATAAAAFWPPALVVAAAGVLGVVALNREFYAYLLEIRGVGFALASVPLHFLYFLVAGLAFAYARLVPRA